MVHLNNFSKIKSPKEVTKQKESRFFLLFCLPIEGSGSVCGSNPLTYGSGSGSRRPKNMWIRWIGSGFGSGFGSRFGSGFGTLPATQSEEGIKKRKGIIYLGCVS
jgi:hypothetical protein